jgi:Fe-S oxidoreductase
MAGSFGYEAEHYDASIAMAEVVLLPAVRKRSNKSVVIADGTSCRHQISDGTDAKPIHVAQLLASSMVR